MTKRHLAAWSVALLSAAGTAAADEKASYHCEDGGFFIATFRNAPGSAELSFSDGRRLTLPQAVSADGGRYADDGHEFWIKGDGASLTSDGKTTTCRVVE